jgi:ABC-type dipeptide/oligopeptide/nickel transport system ATPase component
MSQALEVKALSIAYGRSPKAPLTVKNVNLQVAEGEILGIVGVSGAGKSILARSMTGFVAEPGRYADGSVKVFGTDVTKATQDELRRIRGKTVGIIVQNARSHLNPVLTVGKQIGNVYSAHHRDVDRKAVKELVIQMLDNVGIPAPVERFRAYPHELSGGMAQRCMIAMAMICSPRLLIADEPTSGLDVTIQDQILKLFRRSVREQRSAGVLISRDMGIIANFCDRVAVMHEGEIVDEDNVQSFFSNADHPVSRMLVAAATYGGSVEAERMIASAESSTA